MPLSPPATLPALPPRAFFTHVARPLLARLLAPFGALLATQGFSLSALAAAPASDRASPYALHDVLDALHAGATTAEACAPLLPLFELLAAVHRAASPAGRDSLIRADAARVLPPRLGAEDLAVTACLNHPTLFAQVRVASASDAIKGFVLFKAAAHAEPAFDRDALDATASHLGRWFESKHRTAMCEIHARCRDGERHFEITHGKTPATQELIDESLAMRVVTQVSTARSFAVYDERSRVFAVHALEFIKEGIRKSFGQGCGTGEDFFTKSESLLDTEPLVNLDPALAPDLDLGVERIELREITVTAADRSGASYWPDKGDVRDSQQSAAVRAALGQPGARVTHVKLALDVTGVKRTQLVEIFAQRSQLVYDRRDPRFEATLLALLTKRGIWLGGRTRDPGDEVPVASGASA